MPDTATIDINKAYRAVDVHYGDDASKELQEFLALYGFTDQLPLVNDAYDDGVVTAPYQITQNGVALPGVLRFFSDGRVYNGPTPQHLSASTVRFLMASAFGREELAGKMPSQETGLFNGASRLYGYSPVRPKPVSVPATKSYASGSGTPRATKDYTMPGSLPRFIDRQDATAFRGDYLISANSGGPTKRERGWAILKDLADNGKRDHSIGKHRK